MKVIVLRTISLFYKIEEEGAIIDLEPKDVFRLEALGVVSRNIPSASVADVSKNKKK